MTVEFFRSSQWFIDSVQAGLERGQDDTRPSGQELVGHLNLVGIDLPICRRVQRQS